MAFTILFFCSVEKRGWSGPLSLKLQHSLPWHVNNAVFEYFGFRKTNAAKPTKGRFSFT
jgi:hypothetical protein